MIELNQGVIFKLIHITSCTFFLCIMTESGGPPWGAKSPKLGCCNGDGPVHDHHQPSLGQWWNPEKDPPQRIENEEIFPKCE